MLESKRLSTLGREVKATAVMAASRRRVPCAM
jgi:hypothetical protein